MKKVFKKIGSVLFCLLPFLLAFGIMMLVSIVAVIIEGVFLLLTHPEFASDFSLYYSSLMEAVTGDFSVLISLIYAVIAALALGFWYWKKFVPKKVPKREFGQIINLKMFIGLLILMIGMQYLSTYIVGLTYVINPSWYNTYEFLMENMGFSDVSILLALYSIIIAPISEELIFRGVTLHYAKRVMPFWVANIFQAVLFGVFHGNVVQGVYAFVVGLFCGYVCHRGGSIYLSILFHMLFNLWGTFAPGNFFYDGDSVVLQILMFLLVVAVVFAGFYLYNKGAAERKPISTPVSAGTPEMGTPEMKMPNMEIDENEKQI